MDGDGANIAHSPCAACVHRSKICDENCQLARYFPSSKGQEFLDCHNVLGIRNVEKIIRSVEAHERDTTAASLIVEAKTRVMNPVHGCIAIERMLRSQIDAHLRELDAVKNQLSVFKNLNAQINGLDNSLAIVPQAHGME